MPDEARRVPHRSRAEPLCPVCGEPLGTTVKRHKTLGTFVPRWVPQPCANPECGTATPAADGLPAGRGAQRAEGTERAPGHRRQ